MGEELGLENTVEQWIRLLGTNNKREPVILEVGGADSLDGSKGDGTFRCDDKLIIDNALGHNVHVSVGLSDC